jgi:phospho-N-acetylmuramoyl-pentapeptide-transferase
MLLHLLWPLREHFSALRVVRYPSFRLIAAAITAMILAFILYPWFIRRLQRMQIGQVVRVDGPQSHLSKTGTPTMGGSMILFTMIVPTLLWCDLRNPLIWIVLTVTAGYGFIGFLDDYLKLSKKSSAGVPGRVKLAAQFAVAGGAMAVLFFALTPDFNSQLYLPFLKHPVVELEPWAYALFATLVVVGASNAVNLTDGLDGLATGPVIVSTATFLVLSYAAGTVLVSSAGSTAETAPAAFNIAAYLQIPQISGAGELAVFCAAMIGACIGFLWYNTYPAQVFMGDVGSLPLGGALGTLAVLTKNEFLLVIVGGIFVLETVSVMVQVLSFKLTGKRVFRMAPIHHHFELKGWAEPKVIVRFWIISVVLALIALATLKLR